MSSTEDTADLGLLNLRALIAGAGELRRNKETRKAYWPVTSSFMNRDQKGILITSQSVLDKICNEALERIEETLNDMDSDSVPVENPFAFVFKHTIENIFFEIETNLSFTQENTLWVDFYGQKTKLIVPLKAYSDMGRQALPICSDNAALVLYFSRHNR